MVTVKESAFLLVLLVCPVAQAQLAESELQDLFTQSADNIFLVKPGVTLTAVYNSSRKACRILVSGSVSEVEILEIFNKVAKSESRGLPKNDLVQCLGVCYKTLQFDNVTLTSGVIGKQTSSPSAEISYRTSDCKTAIAKAPEVNLHIQRVNP